MSQGCDAKYSESLLDAKFMWHRCVREKNALKTNLALRNKTQRQTYQSPMITISFAIAY